MIGAGEIDTWIVWLAGGVTVALAGAWVRVPARPALNTPAGNFGP